MQLIPITPKTQAESVFFYLPKTQKNYVMEDINYEKTSDTRRSECESKSRGF